MANEENLNPIRSASVAREMQKKSAAKRSQNAKEKRIIKDMILERMKASDWDEYIDGIIERAKHEKADAEFLRDTLDQKPSSKLEVAVPVNETAKKIKEILDGDK